MNDPALRTRTNATASRPFAGVANRTWLASQPPSPGQGRGLSPGDARWKRVCRSPRQDLARSEGFRMGSGKPGRHDRSSPKMPIPAYRVLVRLARIGLSCRNRLALRKRPRAGRSAPVRAGGGGGGMQVGTRPIADLFIALERGGNVEHRRLGADAIRAAKHIKPFRSEPLHSLASRSTALSPQTRGMCDACSRTRLARRPVSRRGAGAWPAHDDRGPDPDGGPGAAVDHDVGRVDAQHKRGSRKRRDTMTSGARRRGNGQIAQLCGHRASSEEQFRSGCYV